MPVHDCTDGPVMGTQQRESPPQSIASLGNLRCIVAQKVRGGIQALPAEQGYTTLYEDPIDDSNRIVELFASGSSPVPGLQQELGFRHPAKSYVSTPLIAKEHCGWNALNDILRPALASWK